MNKKLVGRVFAIGPEDRGSITGRVLPKTKKKTLLTFTYLIMYNPLSLSRSLSLYIYIYIQCAEAKCGISFKTRFWSVTERTPNPQIN